MRYMIQIFTLFSVFFTFSVIADDYDYPFSDPYVATVVGTPKKWQIEFDIPAPGKLYKLPSLDHKITPEVFWYQEGMYYTLAKQKGTAPLIFIIAGTGSGHNASTMVLLMNAYYSSGYHVVLLSSPTYPNFIATASDSSVPGRLREDAEDLHRAMSSIWEIHSDEIDVSDVFLAGYSLGGAHSAFVSFLDETERKFNFKKVLLINPPVSLYESALILDRLFDENSSIDDPKASHESMTEALDKVSKAYEEDDSLTFDDDLLYSLYRKVEPTTEDLSALIGTAFRLSSANMVFSSDVMTNQGYLKPKDLTLSATDSLTKYLKVGLRIGFIEYFDDFFLPFYQQADPSITRDKLIRELSLRSLGEYLSTSDKIMLVTNEDDIILAEGELEYLKEVFGDRAKIFPNGGHCGNLAHPSFISHMTSVMEGGE